MDHFDIELQFALKYFDTQLERHQFYGSAESGIGFSTRCFIKNVAKMHELPK